MELFCILDQLSYLQVLQDLQVLNAAIMLNNAAAVNAQVSMVALAPFKGCDSASITSAQLLFRSPCYKLLLLKYLKIGAWKALFTY